MRNPTKEGAAIVAVRLVNAFRDADARFDAAQKLQYPEREIELCKLIGRLQAQISDAAINLGYDGPMRIEGGAA